MKDLRVPELMQAGMFVDDRGVMQFINEFPEDFNLKRIYTVENFNTGYVRAWHGHLKESKMVFVTKGSAKIVLFRIDTLYTSLYNIKKDDWTDTDEFNAQTLDVVINRSATPYILSDKNPKLLYIPKHYANGIVSLEPDTKIIVFSNVTLEEAKTDDYRIPASIGRDVFNTEER